MTKRPKKPLRFTHLRLENWRNFTCVDVSLQRRAFLIGPNESGKSNFLDVFRFLHDITATNGGFVTAVGKPWRGGFAKLKSLAAKPPSAKGAEGLLGESLIGVVGEGHLEQVA